MDRKLIAVATVAAALAAGVTARASELIVNGGFDADSPAPHIAPLGWTVTAAALGSFFKVSPDPVFSPDSAPNSAKLRTMFFPQYPQPTAAILGVAEPRISVLAFAAAPTNQPFSARVCKIPSGVGLHNPLRFRAFLPFARLY